MREIDEGAGTEIIDKRNVVRMSESREIMGRYFGGEAIDAVVRCMDLENEPALGADRGNIILGMRAVGRTDFDELRPGAAHDLRQAKGAADLDELAARHDRLASPGERIEDEQDRRGIV